MKKIEEMSEKERLVAIARVIESVDHRCGAADGPVTPTDEEITLRELKEIYAHAIGDSEFLK